MPCIAICRASRDAVHRDISCIVICRASWYVVHCDMPCIVICRASWYTHFLVQSLSYLQLSVFNFRVTWWYRHVRIMCFYTTGFVTWANIWRGWLRCLNVKCLNVRCFNGALYIGDGRPAASRGYITRAKVRHLHAATKPSKLSKHEIPVPFWPSVLCCHSIDWLVTTFR
jgi:hypothetical protein